MPLYDNRWLGREVAAKLNHLKSFPISYLPPSPDTHADLVPQVTLALGDTCLFAQCFWLTLPDSGGNDVKDGKDEEQGG